MLRLIFAYVSGGERSMSRSVAVSGERQLAVHSVADVIDRLTARDTTGEVLTAIRHFPARQAQWKPMPEWVGPELRAAYDNKGVGQLYSHQAAAVDAVHSGRNAVMVTPTASGKTLCYNLPVLQRGSGKSRHARAVSVPHQGARAGSAGRTARSGAAPGKSLRRLHL